MKNIWSFLKSIIGIGTVVGVIYLIIKFFFDPAFSPLFCSKFFGGDRHPDEIG